MPQKIVPMADVVAWLDTEHPELIYEIERDWVWIVANLAPLHRKCTCVQCAQRSVIRRQLVEFGFIYAPAGHELESGEVSHWAHHCEHPIRFKRRGKAGGPAEQDGKSETISDDELLAIIGG